LLACFPASLPLSYVCWKRASTTKYLAAGSIDGRKPAGEFGVDAWFTETPNHAAASNRV